MEHSHPCCSARMLACSKAGDPHNWGQLDQLDTTLLVECSPHLSCLSISGSTPDGYTVNAHKPGYRHAQAVQTYARHCVVTLMHSFTNSTKHYC